MNTPKTPREQIFEQMDRIEAMLAKLLEKPEWVQPKGIQIDDKPQLPQHISATYKDYDPEANTEQHLDPIDIYSDERNES